jgi:hypothetical protein
METDMSVALVYIRGLNTKKDSDWCGMRGFLQSLAALLKADLIDLDFDDLAARDELDTRLANFDLLYAGGHSHGAAVLYQWLETTSCRFGATFFLDLAPPWRPAAWMGPPWQAPPSAGCVMEFHQRNDVPLAGVQLAGPCVQSLDVTPWGLHHSSMCADQRVQDRIALALLWDRAVSLSQKKSTIK